MNNRIPLSLRIVSVIVLILGIAMLVYWGMYVIQGMPVEGIPILSELVNAAVALVSGIGLLRLRKWSIPTTLYTAGMWAYGVIGGISMVLEHGLDFSSPFGAITDAILFPMIFIFTVFLAFVVWRNREFLV
jgi:hypothetical protein